MRIARVCEPPRQASLGVHNPQVGIACATDGGALKGAVGPDMLSVLIMLLVLMELSVLKGAAGSDGVVGSDGDIGSEGGCRF
jgi:hypothetical protein